jgi:DMSO reductase anchor subunit
MKTKNNMELIQPKKQDTWGIAAALNFILGGIATAFYLFIFLFSVFSGGSLDIFQNLSIKLIAPALVTIGFILVAFEAGRPLRGYKLFNNLCSSFMSIEVFAGLIFICSIVLNCIFTKSFFSILAAVSALISMISQGFIFYNVRGIIAWNVHIMPLVTIVSNFTLAGGIVLILATQEKFKLKFTLFIIVLICVGLNAIIWFIYINSYQKHDFQEATNFLHDKISKVLIFGAGHLFPIFLLLLLLIIGYFYSDFNFMNAISVLAGISILFGVISQKLVITVGVDYLRGIKIYKI